MNKVLRTVWKEFGGYFPVTATKIAYSRTKGKRLNLRDPKLVDEKMEYLKLYQYADDPLVIKWADKYAVREYVESKGLGHTLNVLYGVWDDPDEIPFYSFSNEFVLKCTHGCHMNIVCTDKTKFDKEKAIKELKIWQHEKQWKEQQELHYKHIRPRIICEKYLKPQNGTLPPDFKIYCFNGEPKLVLIITDREHEMELTFRDLDWNLLGIGNRKVNTSITRPTCFDEMLRCSRVLSAGIPFVRMDFYDFDGKPIFGEMTFTPAGCNADYYTEEGQKMLGNMLSI